MTTPPIIIQGKQIGRLRASFLLFKESFRFVWADKEMLWVPVLAILFQFFIVGMLVITVLIPAGMLSIVAEAEPVENSVATYAFIFATYLISAFTLAYAQATIAHMVYVRMHNGNPTLWEGLRKAGSHVFALFVWACITSTVGMILRMIAERSQILMRIMVAILGVMWSVLTYFVVPAMVIGNRSAFEAISHSGSVFRKTWGETLVTGISLSLMFAVPIIVLSVILVGGVAITGVDPRGLIVYGGVFIIAIIMMVLLSSVLDSVLRTLLYVYATESALPPNFNQELLSQMLVRKQVSETPVPEVNVPQP